MVAAGEVTSERVGDNTLPWKFAAGTPNILGTIVSAQALRLLIDLALNPDELRRFRRPGALRRAEIRAAMDRISRYTRQLTGRALAALAEIPGLEIYGPMDAKHRTPLVAFNIEGRDPLEVAEALGGMGVEARAGCHCATLAHRALKLNPLASCRLSFYFYNTPEEVDEATSAVAAVAQSRLARRPDIPAIPAPWPPDAAFGLSWSM
jgi:cysteine desulfurase/selenocysteine lyase